MTEITLTKISFEAGTWSGVLTGTAERPPELTLLHEADPLDPPSVTARSEGEWLVQANVPATRLSDGVQTFVIATKDNGSTLASFAFLCGDAMADDIRAEISLLRDELDLLKRAFRRHCVETQSN